MNWYFSLASVGGALLAAIFAILGNHWLQRRIGRRLGYAAEVRRLLYDFMDLISIRWSPQTKKDEVELQAKIAARQSIVLGALRNMRNHSKKLKKWYEDIEPYRDKLVAAASEGNPTGNDQSQYNHARVRLAGDAVSKIISALEAAC